MPRALSHHDHRLLAGQRPGQPGRHVPRRRRTDRGGQRRQPLPDRGGLVVDDVVDAGRAALDRRHGGRGRVVDVAERPDARRRRRRSGTCAARTSSTCTPPGAERGAGAVEAAVAQREALAVPGHRLLQVPDRGQRRRRVGRRGRVERVVLGLDRTAGPRVRPAAEALRDQPAHPGRPGRGEQDVGALGAQPVGLGELRWRTSRGFAPSPDSAVSWCTSTSGAAASTAARTAAGVERVEHGRLGARAPAAGRPWTRCRVVPTTVCPRRDQLRDQPAARGRRSRRRGRCACLLRSVVGSRHGRRDGRSGP